jgi:2-polyprenyl-6-methoxyphenol hydroxylase-like FAD-dependent oxidoreductase
VQDRHKEHFSFLVGADGQNSTVRDCLGIKYQTYGEGEAFVVYEFQTDVDLPHEVRVVLDDKSSNVMWPISDYRCRWSFQLSPADVLAETKIRRPLVARPAEMEKALARHARKLLTERAPWFKGEIEDIDWWIGAYFERRLAERFGLGRCWLAGDAAHRTGPIGVQSMNRGLKEAVDLTSRIAAILHNGERADVPNDYDSTQRQEWVRLMNAGAVEPCAPINSWVAKHRDRILSCIPASGHQLDSLLRQLGLRMSSDRGAPRAEALVFQNE